ncbi:MAG: HAMP domain-containing protein [Pyrinomonadaceae bacterium]|nr:HAMP domain-containing protein [Pyrinomonadaceae bacterium]
MSIRGKLLLIFLAFGIVPLLALGGFHLWRGAWAADALARADVEQQAGRLERAFIETLGERAADIKGLAQAPATRDFLRRASANSATDTIQAPEVSEELRAAFRTLLAGAEKSYAAVSLVAAGNRPLLRVEPAAEGESAAVARWQTDNFLPGQAQVDSGLWDLTKPEVLRSLIPREAFGAGVRYCVPLFPADVAGGQPIGALVVELKLSPLLKKAEASSLSRGGFGQDDSAARPSRQLIAVDGEGHIVYHTNEALMYQPVATAMPHFAEIAREMAAGVGGGGTREFNAPPDGARWLAAYQPVPGLKLSLGVASNHTAATADARNAGQFGLMLAVLASLLGGTLIFVVVGRTSRRIDRVAAAAADIARGNLDQRILVQSSDETQALAESFNLMSDRLREQIAREAETRQFESFLRLSAMLTHDLKNSITGLSMLVNNMERQFHREEFRADAIDSLREATDKLRALVARLSEPVKSLSGEYRRALRPTDLVSLIRRGLATSAGPTSFHEIVTHLPLSLVVTVDPDRIERVVENLVINALEAMGAGVGGRLTVEAGTEPDGSAFFSVSDTGSGMSEEFIRTRLFRAFATTKNKGIGLGLYTCREIVEAHGGRLAVMSKPGAGTTFRVVLPASIKVSAGTPASDKPC